MSNLLGLVPACTFGATASSFTPAWLNLHFSYIMYRLMSFFLSMGTNGEETVRGIEEIERDGGIREVGPCFWFVRATLVDTTY
jgi:hypothetical protein